MEEVRVGVDKRASGISREGLILISASDVTLSPASYELMYSADELEANFLKCCARPCRQAAWPARTARLWHKEASASGAGLASSCPPGRGWGGHRLVWGDHHAQRALETRCQAPLKVDITEQSPAGEKEMAAQ